MSPNSSQNRQGAASRPASHKIDLYLPPYLNGTVLRTVLLSTLIAAIIAIPPLMSETVAARWLWPRPTFFVFALAAIALVSVIMLFQQQRFVISSHRRYESSRAEVLRHSEHNLNRLYALLDVSHIVGKVNSLQEVFDAVAQTCGRVFECDMASLMIHDEKTDELVVRSIGGEYARSAALGDRRKLGDGIAGWAAVNRQSLLLSRSHDHTKYPGLHVKPGFTAMVVPILIQDVLVGVLNVSRRSGMIDYDQEDLQALQVFAENVGTRIRHAQDIRALFQRISQLEARLGEKKHLGPAAEAVLPES